MIAHYLRIAARHINRHKGHAFINIACLSFGMVCCILIMLIVQDSFKVDRFHENADRIHRVLTIGDYGDRTVSALTQAPLAASLQESYPEIVYAACYNATDSGIIKYGAKIFEGGRFSFTDPSFFKMFSFRFLKGNPETVLDDPHSLVITDDIAEKIFGEKDPVGEILEIQGFPSLTVTGVIERPMRSHIDLSYVVPRQLYRETGVDIDTWNRYNYTTYLMLREDGSRSI